MNNIIMNFAKSNLDAFLLIKKMLNILCVKLTKVLQN